jgi:hypothetical protein
MINKRIQAFTIMEVTIAMLLSVIVIGITYTVFSIVTLSHHKYSLKHEEMAKVLQLDELLHKDFDRAEIVLKDTDGIAIKNKNRLTRYRFYGDYILRVGSTTDTFKVKSDSVITSFENQVINSPGISVEQNRLDELDIQLTLQNEKIPYYYRKIYSSVNLINRTKNAVN